MHKPNDPINTSKVIIYAKYRTGSTFASRLIFENHNVSYIFEPLRFEPALGQPSAHLSNGVLWDMPDCNFRTNRTAHIMSWWLGHAVFCQFTGQTPGCIHGQNVPMVRACNGNIALMQPRAMSRWYEFGSWKSFWKIRYGSLCRPRNAWRINKINPINYAHNFLPYIVGIYHQFWGFHLVYFLYSVKVISLVMGQLHTCPSASELSLKYMLRIRLSGCYYAYR